MKRISRWSIFLAAIALSWTAIDPFVVAATSLSSSPASSSKSSGTGGGGLAPATPFFSIGRSGGNVTAVGDSLVAGNGGSDFGLLEDLRLKLRSRMRGSGVLSFTDFTWRNSAVGGQTTHDLFVTHLSDQVLANVNGGDDLIIYIGTNDILGLAGVDSAGPFTTAQSIATYKTGLDAIIAAKSGIRIWVCSIIWAGGEAWTLDSTGHPTGNNSRDATIRDFNAQLKALVATYTSANVRYVDLYTPMYAASAAHNTANTSSGIFTQDGTHNSISAARIVSEVFLGQNATSEKDLPVTIVPASRDELRYSDDWAHEVISYVRSLKHNGAPTAPPLRLNRWRVIDPVAFLSGNAFVTGTAEGNLEGGAITFSGAGPFPLTPTIYQAPKGTNGWFLAFRGKFSALATNRTAFFGLTDATATDAIGVGIDQANNATKFVIESKHGATVAFPAGGASMNADSSVHDFFLWYTGSATGLYELMIDRTHIANLAPGTDFPQTPQAVGQWGTTNGGTVTVERVLYMWAE